VPTADPGLAIQGAVHGGQQAIVGAHVYLFAAGTSGYGGAGLAATGLNASTSLLKASSTGLSDSIGAYVLTGSGGTFSITGDYSCTPNTQVYIYALGGDPGGGVNNQAGLMAVLGNCPSSGNFLTATPFVTVNEVSTVAAAYAFAGFATDATHVSSSGTALAQIGIQNAFANTANLADLPSGTALATTPPPSSNGIAPQTEIYTLGNILASCVNSNSAPGGGASAACTTLFNAALSGGTTGSAPSDTAAAAINIAHNPGANIAALYALPTGQAPFGPALMAMPNDFTVGIQYTGGGLTDPHYLAIDGSGDAWFVNNNSTVTELSSLGAPFANSPYTAGGLNVAQGIAIDLSGNAWIANYATNTVTELSSSGSAMTGSPFATAINGPQGIAVDGLGYIWVTGTTKPYSVTRLSSSGVVQSGFPFTTGLTNPRAVAIDSGENAWVTSNSALTEVSVAGVQVGLQLGLNGLSAVDSVAVDNSGNIWLGNGSSTNSSVSEFTTLGAPATGSPFTTGGGVSTPQGVAIDGAGNVWIANFSNTVSELSNNGAAISSANGYAPAGVTNPVGIAVDGSGNVWIVDSSVLHVTELIGAGTPVVTPLAAGLIPNKLGARP
jgi:streptogramin lyase